MKSTHAATAALIGLFLSGTVALAAAPSLILTANDGAANGVQGAEATESPEATETPDASQAPETSEAPHASKAPKASESPDVADGADAQDGHGGAVSAVAKDKSAVGGKHHNHGGAVSAIARATHGQNDESGKSGKSGD